MLSTDMRARLTPRELNRTTNPTTTVEVLCVVTDPTKPSYRVAGIPQRAGDRARLPLGDARFSERIGKCKIVPNTEKVEML